MEITANAVQAIATNSNVLFTDTAVAGNCSIYHRSGSGLVTLKGMTQQCRARFKVYFNANVALPSGATVTPISLALAISGEPESTTTMISTPDTAAAYNNVSFCTYVDVPACCCQTISVKNTTGASINVQNANLIVERVA